MLDRYNLTNLTWKDLERLGTQCQAGQDVAFVVGLDGTRWSVQAFNFTETWSGAPVPEYVLIVLGTGAYAGKAYPFGWQKGDLHSGYVGQKLDIQQERDANDVTRLLATFLGRVPAYPVGSELAVNTERAELSGEGTIVVRQT